jgi:hypothetical protein
MGLHSGSFCPARRRLGTTTPADAGPWAVGGVIDPNDDEDNARELAVLTRRLYRLQPWMVRALIPARCMGSYVLYDRATPLYVGRSDTCLQRRLLRHAYRRRAPYFTFDIHQSEMHAYTVECAIFHALRPQLSNLIHPAVPDDTAAHCPFCRADWTLPHVARPYLHRTEHLVPSQRRHR